jgi:hypothetical protein
MLALVADFSLKKRELPTIDLSEFLNLLIFNPSAQISPATAPDHPRFIAEKFL